MILLSLLTFIGIFSFILSSNRPSVTKPIKTNTTTFLLSPKQKANGDVEIDIKLQSQLEDISAFTLKINYLGQSKIEINPNPQLEKEGWLFPIAKIKNQQIELAGIFIQPETYSFNKAQSVAAITLKNEKFTQNNFQIDPRLTHVTSRSYQSLSPDIKWQAI